jgi:IS4 transposase
MVMDAVVERFAEHSPVTLMAEIALQKALEAEWIDTLFEFNHHRQYRGELLFSTVVDLMSVVAMGLRPSLHAAAKSSPSLTVSVQALYEKVRHTEPELVRALVQGSAQHLARVREAMPHRTAPPLKDFCIRIIDGSHFPASDKRLKPLRGLRVGALPGQSLVVYDPDLDMVVDMIPGEDGHAQERALTQPLLECAQAGELWIADRNFCTRPILTGWQERGCGFIVREHGSTPHPYELGALRPVGRIETGSLCEQAVGLDDAAGQPLTLRRIELHLDEPTEDGETVIRMLTNLPESDFTPAEVAQLYHRRWRIENMFQRLESVLKSEVTSMGHPRAALLAFGVALLAYNVLSVIKAAISSAHDLEAMKIEISPYYLATEIRASYVGMVIAVPLKAWDDYDAMTARQAANTLMQLAARIKPRAFRSHPRGPKKKPKKGRVSGTIARSHVSTARVLKAAGVY